MVDKWVYKMTITKWKVHRDTGQVEHISGFTKIINQTEGFAGKKPKKEVKLDIGQQEDEYL
jgi:hypothetical protein